MPLYEYRCGKCGDEFETIQKFADRPLTTCKKCGGPLEKLLSRSGFLLKGGGWYADGYKAGKSAGSSGESASSKSPSAPSSGAKGSASD